MTKKLKRALGLSECIFFGVGSILGAGIYAMIGKVAGLGGNMVWMAFIIASLTAIFSALSYAELSALFPKAGGEYVYIKKAAGQKAGTFFGMMISLNGIISGATVSLGFAGYFSQLIGVPALLASLGIILLIFLVNVSGIRQSSRLNIVFTIIEAGGLGFVIYAASSSLGKIDYFESPPGGLNSLLSAAALSFFAYIGFEEIVKLSEETRNPSKNIPRALITASFIVMAVYTLVAICAVSVIPWQELKNSQSPLADIVSKSFGANGALIISVIALFSTSNTILSNMLGSSRVLLNMSTEIGFLKRFSYISSKRQTPVAALIFILIVMSAFALIGNIETIARIANFFILLTFLMVNISVIVLRKTMKNAERPYRIPVNIKNIPLSSLLGILFTLVLTGYTVYGLLSE